MYNYGIALFVCGLNPVLLLKHRVLGLAEGQKSYYFQ